MLEERNRKLERENETLNDKFMASSCIISDLNTKIKDLENDKMSLMTTIKLIQVYDNQYADSCINMKTTNIGDNLGSSEPENSIQNQCNKQKMKMRIGNIAYGVNINRKSMKQKSQQ